MVGRCSLDREHRNTSQRAISRKTWVQILSLLRKPLPCPSKTALSSCRVKHTWKYACVYIVPGYQTQVGRRRCWASITSLPLARLSVIPKETNNQTKPRAPQQSSLLAAIASTVSAVLGASLHPEQNASYFVSPESYSKPVVQSCTPHEPPALPFWV